MKVYDFNALQNSFPSMSYVEILEEYAHVQQELRKTEEMPLTFEVEEARDALEEAKDYLEFFIAAKCCEEHGIEIF